MFIISDQISTRDELSNDASKVGKATSVAVKGAKMIKKQIAKKGAEAAGAALGPYLLIAVAVILGVILVVGVIVASVQLMPSISSNTLLHTNDSEQLAGGEDILDYGDSEQNKSDFDAKIEEVKESTEEILDKALERTKKKLKSKAYWKGWEIREEDLPELNTEATKKTTVMLSAAYSASMHNGVSEYSQEYYQEQGSKIFATGTNATKDFQEKLEKLIKKKNPDKKNKPYGNYFFGADFERDENGDVIVTEEEEEVLVSEAQYDEQGNIITPAVYETIKHKYVKPIIYDVNIQLVAEKAFDPCDGDDTIAETDPKRFRFQNLYEPEVSYERYVDVIIPMTSVAGEILYGTEWTQLNVEEFENRLEHSDEDDDEEEGSSEDIIYPGGSDTGQEGSSSGEGGSSGGSSVSHELPPPLGPGSHTAVEIAEAAMQAENEANDAGQMFRNWYDTVPGKNMCGYFDWCAVFASYCLNQAGLLADEYTFMGTGTGQGYFYNHNKWHQASNFDYTPVPGDMIFFKYRTDGNSPGNTPNHVGIVKKVSGSTVYTIEGNTSNPAGHNGCNSYAYNMNNTWPNGGNILGYGEMPLP